MRCLGWHTEDLTTLPTGELPWAHVMHPVTDPSMHGMGTTPSFLLEGGWVVGFFRDTEYQQPVIIGTLPGVPLNPADYREGFNDPRHKKSTQVNFASKKQYAKEDKDGKVYNPGESGGTIEDYNPAYSQQSYGPYPLGAFVNGEDDKEGVFSRSSGHTVGSLIQTDLRETMLVKHTQSCLQKMLQRLHPFQLQTHPPLGMNPTLHTQPLIHTIMCLKQRVVTLKNLMIQVDKREYMSIIQREHSTR